MSHIHSHEHTGSCCKSQGPGLGVCQSLTEMEFERGIWYAAQTNDAIRVTSLLRKGISANVEDAAGYTALHYAARNGHYEICKELLENNANVNAATRNGRATPLHRAATQGHKKIVELLLQFGADINLLDADNCSALHRAIASQSKPICQLLIQKTNPSLVNNAGLTPFQLAVETKDPDIICMFENKQ